MGDVIEVLTTATNTVEVEAAGPQGIPGVGVPTGGSALQVLRKKTGTDYDTEWATGGGGASYDQELNTTDSVTFESVTADKVAFDLTAAETAAQGELAWNADEETLDLGLAHGSVLQVGQETLYHVENSTASTITAGTLCVFSGTVGNSGKLRVAPHANNTNPTTILGVATSTIAAGVGEEGYVTHFGKCRGINASGGAEAWANGDLLYASPTGGLTKTKPSAPIVTVAAVVSNNSSSGTLFVRPSFGQTAADVGAASSTHASSHFTAGSDPIAPSDIKAQGAFQYEALAITGNVSLSSARAKYYSISTPSAITATIALPTGQIIGDRIIIVARQPWTSGSVINIETTAGAYVAATITQDLASVEFIATSATVGGWDEIFPTTHTHLASAISDSTTAGRALLTGADAAAQRTSLGLGTAATSATGDFAAASHSHGNINSSGQVGSDSGRVLVTTTAGAVTTLALGAAGTVLTVNSGATGVEFAAASGGDTVSITSSAADVLSVSSGAISAVDATADKIVFWDDSASALKYLEAGSGLSISGTTLTATASGGVTTGSVDNAIIRADGTGGSTSQNSDIIIDDATTSTQNNVALRNNHSETNSALVLTPKGNGAFIVGPKPDGTATGGSARGTNSIDIQLTRTNANQVASGTSSVAIGANSRASGSESYCIGGGAASTATRSLAIGFNPIASGEGGVAIGELAAAGGLRGVAIGRTADANLRAMVSTIPFNAVYWGGQTTNNAATILNLDATATNRFTIAANTALAVDILLVARRSDTADKWLVARRFLGIRRDGSNNTSLIGAVQTLGTDQSAGSPTWTFALTADDTNEALQLEVTGATSETVQWRATAIYRVV
jgi:phage gp37-like protein